jgi:Rha family phage regulatory protein
VLRAIDKLIADAPACASNFGETSAMVGMPKGGVREDRHFEMTEEGFTLLAMGFTGKEALEWKVLYIRAFKLMRDELANRDSFTLRHDFPSALRALADATEHDQQANPVLLVVSA